MVCLMLMAQLQMHAKNSDALQSTDRYSFMCILTMLNCLKQKEDSSEN